MSRSEEERCHIETRVNMVLNVHRNHKASYGRGEGVGVGGRYGDGGRGRDVGIRKEVLQTRGDV